MHRASIREHHEAASSPSLESSDAATVTGENATSTQWTWPDAEERLSTAFETGGFSGWAAAVLQELEAEGEIERKKRGHS